MMNKKVWVNGCFDILHAGHIKLLEFAKMQGDFLYVGLDSDYRITQSKGEGRPINDWKSRVTIMESIKYVDMVTFFDTDYQLERLIEEFKPNVMVIGEEYREKRIIGGEFCEKITYFPRYNNLSTTNLINIIKNDNFNN